MSQTTIKIIRIGILFFVTLVGGIIGHWAWTSFHKPAVVKHLGTPLLHIVYNGCADVYAVVTDTGRNGVKYWGYPQPTPKQRILAALWDIKKAQYPELTEPPVYVEDILAEKEEIVNA